MSGSKAAHPPEFMQYLKQRDAALDSVKTIETELRDTQSKLYDAMKRIDDLTKVCVKYLRGDVLNVQTK